MRIIDPENLDDEGGTCPDLLIRPRWLNWVARVGTSEEEFLQGLSGQERRNVRLGRRFIQEEDLRLDIGVGLTEALVDEFLVLYAAQIAAMPRGVDFAHRWRDRMLADTSEHLGAWLFEGSRLVAGSIWRLRTDKGVLQLRFSATAPWQRSGRVVRALYVAAFQFARDMALPFASLGNDPSLFGHVVQPGLFAFKGRLGFTPVPAEVLDPRLAGDFAERFLRLRGLAQPSLVVTRRRGQAPLTWPEAVTEPTCDLVLLAHEPSVDASAFRIPAMEVSRTLHVPV